MRRIQNQYELEVPHDTRQPILRDVEDAYDSAFSNIMAGYISHFDLGQKKGDRYKIFHISKRAINENLDMFKQRKVGKLRTRKNDQIESLDVGIVKPWEYLTKRGYSDAKDVEKI